MSKKKKKKAETDEIKPIVVNRSPGFSSRFKEDLAWWFKQDFQKASKILDLVTAVMENPEGKVRQNWTTFSSPGFGIANFSFLAGKTSYLLITKLGLLTIKMLVLPRLSNFVQFHWTPFDGIGKPEPLKYMDADIWSRRIDLEHRLVYRIGNTQIDFLACRYHYK